MTQTFEYSLTVGRESIDENGHVNNIEYMKWMERAAILHTESVGWNHEAYKRIGRAWFARSNHIDYYKPTYEGEEITVKTWVQDMKRIKSTRIYEIIRSEDGTLLAKGETQWVFVDIETGRPAAITDEVAKAFFGN